MSKSRSPLAGLLKDLNARKIAAYLIIILFFFGFIFIASSFHTIDPNEAGLRIDNLSNTLEEKVYYEGRYFKPFSTFIIFSLLQEQIEFSDNSDADAGQVSGLSINGTEIVVEVSFNYQINPSSLINLYRTLAADYEPEMITRARAEIRNTISKFPTTAFFRQRDTVENTLEQAVRTKLSEIYFNLPDFQLRDIILPTALQETLNREAELIQQLTNAKKEQEIALVQAETEILQAQAQRNITLIEANATAEAFLINMEAQAQALNITLTAQAQSYQNLAMVLNLNSTELLAYLWIQALQDIGEYGNLIIIGENTPFINLTTSTNSTNSN